MQNLIVAADVDASFFQDPYVSKNVKILFFHKLQWVQCFRPMAPNSLYHCYQLYFKLPDSINYSPIKFIHQMVPWNLNPGSKLINNIQYQKSIPKSIKFYSTVSWTHKVCTPQTCIVWLISNSNNIIKK